MWHPQPLRYDPKVSLHYVKQKTNTCLFFFVKKKKRKRKGLTVHIIMLWVNRTKIKITAFWLDLFGICLMPYKMTNKKIDFILHNIYLKQKSLKICIALENTSYICCKSFKEKILMPNKYILFGFLKFKWGFHVNGI